MTPSAWGAVAFGVLAVVCAAAGELGDRRGDDRADSAWDLALIFAVGLVVASLFVRLGR